jgi:O-succinylbenzoic acid--CoA ligase
MEFKGPDPMKVETYHRLNISGNSYDKDQLKQLINDKLKTFDQKSWEYQFYKLLEAWISDHPNIIAKTSGSTGYPKKVEIDKNRMIQSTKMTGDYLVLQQDQKALLCLPVNTIAGTMMVIRAFVLGLNLFPIKPTGNPLQNINEDFDFAAMTPFQVYNIMQSKEGENKLNKIKNLIIGGADISFELYQKIKQLNNNTYHTYGMTETITHVAMKKLTGCKPDNFFNALPGVRFSLDEKNCLVIHAPHLSERIIVTNDIVELENDTQFNFIGRYDHIINSGGIKISPEVVENKLSPYIKQRFVITSLTDDRLGEKVVLAVEGTPDKSIEFDNIFQKARLDRYEIPKRIIFMKKFQETTSGKVIRHHIKEKIQQTLK